MTVESASRRHMARWRPAPSALALLCSVCLNIAFASYIAVQAWTAEPHSPEHPAPDATIAAFAARLPSHDADILRQAYRAKESQVMAAVAAAQQARVRALSVLSQRDLDTNALRAAFKEATETRARVGELLVETVVEALERISPDGRRQLTKEYHLR